jgi:hypothetical protein
VPLALALPFALAKPSWTPKNILNAIMIIRIRKIDRRRLCTIGIYNDMQIFMFC